MSKAEERALEAYPKDIEEYIDVKGVKSIVDNNSWQRTIFLEGYRQAEKDNELTWEDIGAIDNLLWDLSVEHSKNHSSNEVYYKEVLKRFKAQKGEKV